jgi:aminoglycoside phosphotransferase (APT) family kinase protein
MHADEREIDEGLVRRLVDAQLPQWADLPLERVPSWGTDNALYRLGGELVVRLPRIGWAAGAAAKEQEWLARLAPLLPVDVPEPVARGEPAAGYPWGWTVCRWLEGENPSPGSVDAGEAAALVRAFRGLDPTVGPAGRGTPLARDDAAFRTALGQVDEFDRAAVLAGWEEALAAPAYDGPPVWTHGDLLPGNLLVREGRLTGLLDFGTVGVGDPAVDCLVAWSALDATGRADFRALLDVDDDTWARGRGWALRVGVIALPYYRDTNTALAATARVLIREALPASS